MSTSAYWLPVTAVAVGDAYPDTAIVNEKRSFVTGYGPVRAETSREEVSIAAIVRTRLYVKSSAGQNRIM
jgi:hypothetical protein